MLFDEVHVLPCRIEDLDVVERAMIELYRPFYNIKLKPPTLAPTLPSAAVIASRQSAGFVRRM
jgi:hypothetical protein